MASVDQTGCMVLYNEDAYNLFTKAKATDLKGLTCKNALKWIKIFDRFGPPSASPRDATIFNHRTADGSKVGSSDTSHVVTRYTCCYTQITYTVS